MKVPVISITCLRDLQIGDLISLSGTWIVDGDKGILYSYDTEQSSI
jgi:hypothetical protein